MDLSSFTPFLKYMVPLAGNPMLQMGAPPPPPPGMMAGGMGSDALMGGPGGDQLQPPPHMPAPNPMALSSRVLNGYATDSNQIGPLGQDGRIQMPAEPDVLTQQDVAPDPDFLAAQANASGSTPAGPVGTNTPPYSPQFKPPDMSGLANSLLGGGPGPHAPYQAPGVLPFQPSNQMPLEGSTRAFGGGRVPFGQGIQLPALPTSPDALAQLQQTLQELKLGYI